MSLRRERLPEVPSGPKVLVTGGLGFVGSQLCRTLMDFHCTVLVLDDESRGDPANVAGLDIRRLKVDVRDRAAVENAFSDMRPDVVIHLAAMHFIPDCNSDPAACLQINVIGTENVLAACRVGRVRRVLVTSSVAVYPISDEANREIDPADPYDVYGESKLVNELQARRFCLETGIDTVAVRLSNVYGPRETNPHVVPEIMSQLRAGASAVRLGNIDPMRDFIYTRDAAEGFAALTFNPLPAGFHIVNLGGGREYSVRQILDELSIIMQKDIKPVQDPSRVRKVDRMHLRCDIGKIYELAGWEPQVDLKEGLEDLCRWYGLGIQGRAFGG